ncbi:MAG: 50S ribosomal protein L22 [Candidatus Nomurabacteria bacterium]|nr:50S ribosomal protein L22 [Candidatus Nomurabacteria bacterium]
MKAFLKNYRQAPRKVRLVSELVKGKSVDQAIVSLDFLAKRAGEPIKKLILSAVANAKQIGAEQANLFIKEITVDKGIVMKRMMPRAMGRGARINKRTSHVEVLLAERAPKVKKIAKVKAEKTVSSVKVKKVSTKVKK